MLVWTKFVTHLAATYLNCESHSARTPPVRRGRLWSPGTRPHRGCPASRAWRCAGRTGSCRRTCSCSPSSCSGSGSGAPGSYSLRTDNLHWIWKYPLITLQSSLVQRCDVSAWSESRPHYICPMNKSATYWAQENELLSDGSRGYYSTLWKATNK